MIHPGHSHPPIKVWLKNAKVEFKTNRWPDAKILDCKTDNLGYVTDMDGNREIYFSFCAGNGHTFKEVTMQISMCDPNNSNKLRVKDAGSWQNYFVHISPDIDLGYSTTHPIVSGQFGNQVADWWEYSIPIDNYGLLYTQLGWAKEYTNNEWQGTGKSLNKNLAIKIEEDNKLHDQSDAAHYNPINNTIHLGTNRYQNEGTAFHEFGHYVFTDIYGSWNYEGNSTHFETWNNVGPKMTMGEGVASAFAGIIDEMTWAILGNSSNEREYHIRPIFRNLDLNGNAIERLSAPVLSEHYLASVMLDLWDGESNYAKYNNTLSGLIGPNTLDNNNDNFEMPFKDICAVFWNNQGNINNLYDFYNLLIIQGDCNSKGYIRRIFQYNSDNIDGGLNSNNFPKYNSDDIANDHFFTENGYNIKKIVSEGGGFRPSKFPTISHNFSLKRNKPILNNTIDNFNIDVFKILFNGNLVKESSSNQFISDNLNITNGARLEVNTNNPSMFYNNGGVLLSGQNLEQPNSTLNLSVCTITKIEVDNNSNIIIGANSNRNANVNFTNSSFLELKNSSTLTINNNSSLTIEPGATLIIHPGAQIILNGPNAVLHIKGRIILEENADFNPIAGANGYGKVVFDNSSNGFIIDARRNVRIIIDPESKPTNLNQFNLEVIGNVVVITQNPQGVILNKPISLFEILNANVLINDLSSLESRTIKTNLNNSAIMGVTNKSSIGFIASRSEVTINQTRFEWLNTGFENKLNNIGHKRVNITNSQFIKCRTGIKMNGGFVKVENCQFNSWGRLEGYGVKSYSSSTGDLLIDNLFQMPASPKIANHSKTFDYFGKHARVFRNVFVDNNMAINNRDGEMFIECNNFQSWTFRELSYSAISSKNGKLFLNTGRNLFAHYQTYLNTDNSVIQVKNGENFFKLGETNLNQLYFNFKINNNQLPELLLSANSTGAGARYNTLAFDFSNNHWKESINPNASDFRPIPANNFNINIENQSGTTYDLGYLPLPTSGVSNYIGFQNSFCSSRYTDIDKPLKDIEEVDIFDRFSTEYTIPNSDPKKPSSIVNTNYIDVVLNTFEKANELEVNYEEVLPEIIYIAQIPLPDTSKKVAMYIYDLSQHIYNLSLTDTTTNDSIRTARRTFLGELMLKAQDTLLTRSYANDSFWLSIRYELLRDKAEILRTLDRRTEAISILDVAIIDSTLSDLKKSHATTWRCFIKQEQDLIDSIITIDSIDFALCLPEDILEIHTPYTTITKDTTINFCYTDVNNISYEWTNLDQSLQNIFYDESGQIIAPSNSNSYVLSEGEYTLTSVDSTNKIFYYTEINIIATQETNINDSLYFSTECENLPFVLNVESEYDQLFNQHNLPVDSISFKSFALDPSVNKYRMEYRNSSTCKYHYSDLIFNINETGVDLPSLSSAYLYADYDLSLDSCAFVALNEVTCNSQNIEVGQTFDVYNSGMLYLFTAQVQLFGESTKGFRFCPPHWNTDETHIHDWHTLFYKTNPCEYCRIDFKADSTNVFYRNSSIKTLNNLEVNMYPNPTNKVVNIQVNANIEQTIQIKVYNQLGQLVKTELVNLEPDGIHTMSLEGLSQGIYHVMIPELGFAKQLVLIFDR